MSTFWLQMRCLKCHVESESLPISLEQWPMFIIDKSLKCMHRRIEIRLYEEEPQDIAIVEGLLAKE